MPFADEKCEAVRYLAPGLIGDRFRSGKFRVFFGGWGGVKAQAFGPELPGFGLLPRKGAHESRYGLPTGPNSLWRVGSRSVGLGSISSGFRVFFVVVVVALTIIVIIVILKASQGSDSFERANR